MGEQDGKPAVLLLPWQKFSLQVQGTQVQALVGDLDPTRCSQHGHRKKKASWDCHGLNCVPEFTYGSPDPQHLGWVSLEMGL